MDEDLFDKKENYLTNLPLKGIENYSWNILQSNKMENSEVYIFSGINKLNKEDVLLAKQINIDKDKFKDREYIRHILREFNLVFSLKNYDYFQKKISGLISKDENYLYLIINENLIPLNYIILSQLFNYLDNKEIVKWIIYQTTFGLYVLHSNNIIHHDIKPSNIFINDIGGIRINGFTSAIFKNEKSFQYTLSYSAPELLIGYKEIDEKIDLWNLGILLLELFLKKTPFLYNKNIKNGEEQLFYNLEKLYGIKKENYSINDLIEILNGNNNNINFKIEQQILDKIEDKNAIFLLNHLLNFNPKERYTSQQVLNSDYLKEYMGIDSLDIQPIKFIIDNDEVSKTNILEKNVFLELIKKVIS